MSNRRSDVIIVWQIGRYLSGAYILVMFAVNEISTVTIVFVNDQFSPASVKGNDNVVFSFFFRLTKNNDKVCYFVPVTRYNRKRSLYS